ncbi:MAG: transposase [Nitrosomonas sp.]|nr:transposase [Nitrosomonas sp.]
MSRCACDWCARGRVNVICALIGHCLLTVGLFKNNIDADIFFGWMVHDLLPKLPPASVVVMDNATFHKRQDIQHTLLHKPDIHWNINQSIHQTLTPLSTNGFKPKRSENN